MRGGISEGLYGGQKPLKLVCPEMSEYVYTGKSIDNALALKEP